MSRASWRFVREGPDGHPLRADEERPTRAELAEDQADLDRDGEQRRRERDLRLRTDAARERAGSSWRDD